MRDWGVTLRGSLALRRYDSRLRETGVTLRRYTHGHEGSLALSVFQFSTTAKSSVQEEGTDRTPHSLNGPAQVTEIWADEWQEAAAQFLVRHDGVRMAEVAREALGKAYGQIWS
jgi:hypothetical protein